VRSSTDLRYREVLENLAMIADNPAILPSFSSIYAGTTDISDTLQASSQTIWLRMLTKPFGSATLFSTESLDVPATRAVKQNWTLDPVIVPEKLAAMRCACWWALFGPEHLCGNCLGLQKYQDGAPP
jgi:hypothetical protein